MKAGVKPILAALAILFGSALLLASVHAQSSFTHSNNLIPNSLTAFSVATGGTLNFVPALQDSAAPPPCPKQAAAHGDTADTDGGKGRIDDDAQVDCYDNTSGTEDVEDSHGKKCSHGTVESLVILVPEKEVEEKGECDTETGEKANFDLKLVKNVPLMPNTFVITWATASGSTSYLSGMLIDGYELVP
jgi:hypothetical protein